MFTEELSIGSVVKITKKNKKYTGTCDIHNNTVGPEISLKHISGTQCPQRNWVLVHCLNELVICTIIPWAFKYNWNTSIGLIQLFMERNQ